MNALTPIQIETADPFLILGPAAINLSGGRTSGYMMKAREVFLQAQRQYRFMERRVQSCWEDFLQFAVIGMSAEAQWLISRRRPED